MRTLFDQLVAEVEAGIDRLVSEQQQENVTLDFKEKRTPTRGALDQEDRKTLAKALSAFANSAGGLLVYGVKARKGADGVDCAQEAKPISEIRRFLSEATTATGELIQPRHDGIEVHAIPSERAAGAGYLLFLVQRSERRPHRSEAAGQKQYFKRAGDSSFEMEHYDIEDAFRRISVPDMQVSLIRPSGSIGGVGSAYRIDIALSNNGNVSAENVYCHLTRYVGCKITHPLMKHVIDDGHDLALGNTSIIIHPQLSVYLSPIVVEVVYPTFDRIGDPEGFNLDIELRFGCKNSRSYKSRFFGTFRDLPVGRFPLIVA